MHNQQKILKIRSRQTEILNMFSKKDQRLVNEAMNIEYTLAMIEQGYSFEDAVSL